MDISPINNVMDLDGMTDFSFGANGSPLLNMNWGGMGGSMGMDMNVGGINYNPRSPISGQFSNAITPNYSTGMTNYTAPWSDAFNYGKEQLTGGNISGGIQDMAGWGLDKLGNTGVGKAASNLGNSAKNFWGDMSNQEKFSNALGGAQALFGMYAGAKQLGMAKKQMGMQKDMWNKTWDANKKATNEALEYRSQLRNNNNASSVKKDLDQYGIK